MYLFINSSSACVPFTVMKRKQDELYHIYETGSTFRKYLPAYREIVTLKSRSQAIGEKRKGLEKGEEGGVGDRGWKS